MPRNWFDQAGLDYARHRPDYPPELAAYLAGLVRTRDDDGDNGGSVNTGTRIAGNIECGAHVHVSGDADDSGNGGAHAPARRATAVDLGCGTGQFSRDLAAHFGRVIGLDPSQSQLRAAAGAQGLSYVCARAEALPLRAASVDLITAAQAAHWFDLPRAHAEIARIARPGAVVAFLSYGVLRLDAATVQARFTQFYDDQIGPYWPPERAMVDHGYAGMDFPYDPLPPPAMTIRRHWDLAAFLGYIGSWSAVRRAAEAGRTDIAARFSDDLAQLWGDPATARAVTWPVSMRLGRTAMG